MVTARPGATAAIQADAELVSFSCNDYLGLSQHPEVVAASVEATRRYGVGAGSSRLVTGNHPLYVELERKLAELKGTEDAVVFGSGYLTNVGVITALAGRSDLIVMDELCHSSLLTGASASGARVLEFRHNDVEHLSELLAAERAAHRHCLVLTDGVFSMEGDLAPLPPLAALAAEHDAWLMTDDAHGLGVVGDGRGSSFAFGEPVAIPLQMGTLSKAAGVYGGYLCTSRDVAELVRNRARSFVYSTGLPPGTVAAASRALELIATDKELVRRPLARAREFTAALDAAGGAERDRVVAHGQRRSRTRGERVLARSRLSRRGDPAAHGAARHVAAARDLLRRAYRGAGRGARGRGAPSASRMTAVFVTSSGTGIGKTLVTLRLIEELKAAGRSVQALKPVASGFDAAHPEGSDTALLLRAQGLDLGAKNLDAVSPWRFAAPLSPDMAASRERRSIPFDALVAHCRAASERRGVTLIEGIGGVMTPLDAEHTVLDWIEALGAPALLVVGSYLGTLSHSLTAASALRARGVTIAGVVVSESEEQPVPAAETAATLARFLAPVPVCVLPRAAPVPLLPLVEAASEVAAGSAPPRSFGRRLPATRGDLAASVRAELRDAVDVDDVHLDAALERHAVRVLLRSRRARLADARHDDALRRHAGADQRVAHAFRTRRRQRRVVRLGAAGVRVAFEADHGALHRLDQRGELREPLLGRAADAALLRPEEHLDRQRLLEIAAVRDALAEQLGVLRGHGALADGEQRLELACVNARLRGTLVGIAPGAALAVKTVAEPAAERRAEHEADGAARERADRGAAAETDRLFLGNDARLVFRGTVLRPRKARRREHAADHGNEDLLGNEFRLHGSLLKRKVVGHGRYLSEPS